MTSDILFSAMSGINSDYVISAATWMTAAPPKDRRRTLRFTLIAAALLVLVTIPIAVIIANHYGITPPPPIPTITTDTTAAPTTTEKVYQSLYDIPGAVSINGVTPTETEGSIPTYAPPDRELWKQSLRANRSGYFALMGTILQQDLAIVPNGNGFYHVMTLTVNVQTPLNFQDAPTEFRCVYVCEYQPKATVQYPENSVVEKSYSGAYHLGHPSMQGIVYDQYTITTPYYLYPEYDDYCVYTDMSAWIKIGESGFPNGTWAFLVESITEQTLTVNNQEHALSDYADYLMIAHFSTNTPYYITDSTSLHLGRVWHGGFQYGEFKSIWQTKQDK